MIWSVEFLDEAKQDLRRLDHSVQTQVIKGIRKVSKNPVSIFEGGYGKPLGNRSGSELAGLYKIKYSELGIRVVYQLVATGSIMKIIVISARAGERVYKDAARRRTKYGI